MSKFTQINHGNSQGIQVIPKGREADFAQHQVGSGGDNRSVRIVVEPDVDVQTVHKGEVKFQAPSSQQRNKPGSTFVQHNYGGIGFQAHEMKTTYK